MPELRRHDRPDQPEHAQHASRGVAEIRRLVDMQKESGKAPQPSQSRGVAEIRRLVEMQTGSKRGFIYSTPDKHQHSPEKSPQKNPDLTGPYGPMSDAANEPDNRDAASDRRRRAARVADTISDNAEDVANDVQATVDTVVRLVDPERPAAHQIRTGTRQPDRPIYNPAAKDAPHDVVSNLTIAAIFVAEAGRRIYTKSADAMTHRRQDTA